MTLSLCEATTPDDYDAFAGLCREYVDWCRVRYAHDAWFVSEVFGYQSLDAELQDLAVKYGAPNGRTLLVKRDDQIIGGGAYRRRSDTVCEMKRLFISTRFSGHGAGRLLATALMEAARAEGYSLMQLDTGNLLKEAIGLYTSLGFEACPPYLTYPDRLMPYLVFMQKHL